MKKFFLILSVFATVSAKAQNVAINIDGTAADSSAILDISANNKGILLPRIFLTSSTDATAVPGPAPYLVVYNISVSSSNGLAGAGLYTNIGNALNPNWQRLGNSVPGPAGPAATVKTGVLLGYAGASIAANSTVYVFAGPTASVSITANQKILVWGSVPLGLAAGTVKQTAYIGAGYQSTVAGSVISNMAGFNYSISELSENRGTYAFAGSIAPGAGTYNIGCVVRNLGAAAITNNDFVNGIYMIVDN